MTAHARSVTSTTDDGARPGYAPPGVRFRGYAAFVAAFAGTVAVILLAVSRLLSTFERPVADARASPPFVAPPGREAHAVAPEPRLQPSPGHETMPWQDVQRMQREQWDRLAALGWQRDAATGRAVVPDAVIERVGAQIAAARRPPATSPASAMTPACPLSTSDERTKGEARP